MAKTNKSQMVRDILTANPDMKAKEVVAAVAEMGHKISGHLVYYIKGEIKAGRQRKAHVVKAAKAATERSNGMPSSNADVLTMIRDVKGLAQKAGGYQKLKELVDALSE